MTHLIYIYIHIYICICIYIYIFIYSHKPTYIKFDLYERPASVGVFLLIFIYMDAHIYTTIEQSIQYLSICLCGGHGLPGRPTYPTYPPTYPNVEVLVQYQHANWW